MSCNPLKGSKEREGANLNQNIAVVKFTKITGFSLYLMTLVLKLNLDMVKMHQHF